MSGIEVAGLILGVLPLLISGMEHYRDGADRIVDVVRYKAVLGDLVCYFDTATARFSITCEKILGSLTLSDVQFSELLQTPGGEAWKQSSLDKQLRARLGTSYRAYSSTMIHLHKKINQLAGKLGLDKENDMKPTWVDATDERLLKLWKRVKFSFDHNRLSSLVDKIEHDIAQLEALTAGNLELGLARSERKRHSNSQYWINIRNRATTLYKTLDTGWACECAKHQASLRLKSRKSDDWERHDDFRFNILFTYDSEMSNAATSSWSWKDTEIEQSQLIATTLINKESQPPQLPIRQKGVSFATLPSFSSSLTTTETVSSIISVKNTPEESISCLCKALSKPLKSQSYVGVLEHDSWLHRIFISGETLEVSQQYPPQALCELLNSTLDMKVKYQLAITLASTVLQLYSTPWLSKTWDLRDIYLFRNLNDQPLYQQLYVSKCFPSGQPDLRGPEKEPPLWAQSPIIWALGVCLLELSFGRNLDTFKTAAQLEERGDDAMLTEFKIITTLSNDLEGREGYRYADVVKRCLFFRFDAREMNLDDPAFQETFYQRVVVPLQECYNFLCPPS